LSLAQVDDGEIAVIKVIK